MLNRKPYRQKLYNWYFTIAGGLRILPDILLIPIKFILVLCALPFLSMGDKLANESKNNYGLRRIILILVVVALGFIGAVIVAPAALLELASYLISRGLALILVGPIFLLGGFFIETKHSVLALRFYGKYYLTAAADTEESFAYLMPRSLLFISTLITVPRLQRNIKELLTNQNMNLKDKLESLHDLIRAIHILDLGLRKKTIFLEFFHEYHQQILSKYTYLDIITLKDFFNEDRLTSEETEKILDYYYDDLAGQDYNEMATGLLINKKINLKVKLAYLYGLIWQNKHVKTENKAFVFVEFLNKNFQHISPKSDTDVAIIESFLAEENMLIEYERVQMEGTLSAFHGVNKERNGEEKLRIPRVATNIIMEFNGPPRHKPAGITGYLGWKGTSIFALTKDEKERIGEILSENELKEGENASHTV